MATYYHREGRQREREAGGAEEANEGVANAPLRIVVHARHAAHFKRGRE